MELGNLFFGNSNGEYPLPNRDLVDSKEWEELLNKTQLDFYGIPEIDREFCGFDNKIFAIRPYYWGECTCGADNEKQYGHMVFELDIPHKFDCKLVLPNFLYKPTNFEIRWYKYPFRDSYINQNLNEFEICEIFKNCINSLK